MDVFVPGILAMSLMNSGVIGLATAFVTYRERGILRRIRVTPFPLTSFILARVISQLLLAGLQAVILIGMAGRSSDSICAGIPSCCCWRSSPGRWRSWRSGLPSPDRTERRDRGQLRQPGHLPHALPVGHLLQHGECPCLAASDHGAAAPYLVDALREPMSFGNGLSAIWLDLLALMLTFVIAMAIAVRFFRWDSRPHEPLWSEFCDTRRVILGAGKGLMRIRCSVESR